MMDAKVISANLREKDQQEAINLGLNPVKGVFFSYRNGFLRRTVLLNDKPVAIFGVSGSPLGMVGYPYLITSKDVLNISPIKFSRIYKQQVEVMKNLYPYLENYVDASYEGACRMLSIAGFELTGPVSVNGSDFYRFHMKGNI